jgi:drug/metabolite transporter (DMT)-like permease
MLARESTISIHLYSSLAVMLIALLTSFHGWVPLSLHAWLSLALSGLGFGFGIFFVTDALRYADVSLVSPFKYTGVVWALALGYLMWGEVPTALVVAGALVIVGSGLFLLRRSSLDGVR